MVQQEEQVVPVSGSAWRGQIAERVAAHRATRSSGDTSSASASQANNEVERRREEARRLAERAAENIKRRIEERLAREEEERREREEIESFFAEFNAPRAPAAPAAAPFPLAFAAAPAPAPVPAPAPAPAPASNVIPFPGGIKQSPEPVPVAVMNTPAVEAEVEQFLEVLPTNAPAPAEQLSIFETMLASEVEEFVPEPVQLVYHAPALRLDEHLDFLEADAPVRPEAQFELPLKAAPFTMRFWAGVIDVTVVSAAALGFASVFYALQHSLPHGKVAAALALATVWLLWVIYQVLFLVYSGTTLGMKTLRLGLSDYEDRVPTASDRMKRAMALACSSMSGGMGFFWALLDEDRLAWHDKMTRTYPRELA
jgi:uncharacterized RDD family membrane protein YckC